MFVSDVTHKIEPIDRLKDHSILTIQPCIEYEVKLHIEFEVRKLSFYIQNLGKGNKIYIFGTFYLVSSILGDPNIQYVVHFLIFRMSFQFSQHLLYLCPNNNQKLLKME